MSTATLPHDLRAEPISGVRYSKVRITRTGQLQFGGISYGTWAEADTPAACAHRYDHDAPDPGCDCGYWLCADLDALRFAAGDIATGNPVEVTAWGRVVEHESGWRAERVRIDTVLVPGPNCGCGTPADRVEIIDGAAHARCESCAPNAATPDELELLHRVKFRIVEIAETPEPAADSVWVRSSRVEAVAWGAFWALMAFVVPLYVDLYVAGEGRWSGTTFGVPRPHLWWIPVALTWVFSAAAARYVIKCARSGSMSVRVAAIMIGASVALSAASPAAVNLVHTPFGRHTDHHIDMFADEHDLAVEPLEEGEYRFTPRNGEPCDATLTRTGKQRELAGACLAELIDAT